MHDIGKPWLSSLTLLGFEINAAIERGTCSQLTFAEVYSGIEAGNLLASLNSRFPKQFDFSLFPPGSDGEREIIASLRFVAPGLEGRERKKVGVNGSGLSLLMALVLCAIQAKQWSEPQAGR